MLLVRLCADVHVTACLSDYGVSFTVHVMTFLFWINLLFVCNTTGFLSFSLIPPTGVYPTLSLCLLHLFFHFSGLLPLNLLLLCSLCQIHSTPGGNGNNPFIFSVTGDCLTAFILCQHVFGFVCVCVCPHLTFLADMIRFFQALRSAWHFFPTSNTCAFVSENVRACMCVFVCLYLKHLCVCL